MLTMQLATVTHPYFKLRWLSAQLADQQNRLQSMLVTAAKNTVASVGMLDQSKSDDTDDDYFAFADISNGENETNGTSSVAPSTNKHELEVLQCLEDKRKDIAVLRSQLSSCKKTVHSLQCHLTFLCCCKEVV